MFLRIVSILFPVFAIVGAGYLYARRQRRDIAFANQFNMDICVPALVFGALAAKSFSLGSYSQLVLAGALVVLGSGLLAWPVARLFKVEPKTFVPAMMFNNCGNMGLPVMLLAFGEPFFPAAVVLFFISTVLQYSVGTRLLDPSIRLTRLWREPVVAAAIGGIAVSVLDLAIWPPLLTGIRMVGDISIPLLLFTLGIRLNDSAFKDVRLGLLGAVACPLTGLLAAAAVNLVLPLPAEQAAMLLVFGALPPAVINYVLAERYRQEPEKVASIVMVGNLGALVFVPFALTLALK